MANKFQNIQKFSARLLKIAGPGVLRFALLTVIFASVVSLAVSVPAILNSSVHIQGWGWFLFFGIYALSTILHGVVKRSTYLKFGINLAEDKPFKYFNSVAIWVNFGLSILLAAAIAPSLVIPASSSGVILWVLLLASASSLYDFLADRFLPLAK